MKVYDLFQQKHGDLFPVGTVTAMTGPAAIDAAKRLPVFLTVPRNSLAHYPIVQERNEYAH